MICPGGCGPMFQGERLWVCGWCGRSLPRKEPAPQLPQEMINIPAGTFLMGGVNNDSHALDHEKPAKEVSLAAYDISITPVTCGQYMHFVCETGCPAPAYWEFKPPLGENSRHPVCFVSWYNARDYCQWLTETYGGYYELPTEAQWEKAARGGFWLDGDQEKKKKNPSPHRWFPHGQSQLSSKQANFDGIYGGTTPVGSFSQSVSPYGCLDMSGNVSEWCLDTYNPGYYQTMPTVDPCAVGKGAKVLKGGSWRSGIEHVRCSNRYFYQPEQSSYGIGLRVVKLANAASRSPRRVEG